jgi:V/A-type H+/Na+-transporting ATPase subunit C
MRIHGEADFGYGNTRLRARRSNLLSDADYERLLGEDVAGLLGALEQTTYAPDVEAAGRSGSVARLHEAISRHLSRSLQQMRSFYADRARGLVDMMLSRFDVHNVVTVLRAQSGEKREGADALVRVGWMTGSLAREVLRQDELAASVDLLARSTPDRGQGAALRAAFAEYERTEDLAALERAVVADHAARLSADLASAGSAARTLMRVGQREIDERNLLVALRLRDAVASGAEADTPPAATRLPGGSIPLAAFRDALNAPTSAAVVAQLGRVGRGRWRTPLERWAASGNLPALERELERRRIAEAVALFVAGDPLAIDVPIAFMAAKGSEARNLRLLGEAAVRDIDPEIIRRELLWTKAHA